MKHEGNVRKTINELSQVIDDNACSSVVLDVIELL